jgi:putative peptide zinc metalloprotease protein
VLFTPPALAVVAALAVAGLGAFVYLIVGRYGTPFVVARKLGLGGAVFLAGRFALVFLHEAAHGLAMASYGRRVGRAGLKLLFILPYGFVDTSEAWFEPRRHRMVVAAAGPALDLSLGGAFAVACAVAPRGTLRDILFQLAFGAYVGGLMNLNPFLDRDGYHILVDKLGQPGLRRRSREQLTRRLSGKPAAPGDTQLLTRFAAASVGWSVVAAGFAIFMSTRYYAAISHLAPHGVVVGAFAALYVMLFVPVIAVIARPLSRRWAPGRGQGPGAGHAAA